MSTKDIYLIVFAPVYGPSGYAKLSRSFILGLDKLGVKIKLEPNRKWEPNETILPSAEEARLRELERTKIPEGYNAPKLSIGIAPWFDMEYSGYKIGYTMFEFTNIPNIDKYDWKTACSVMDEVWVPSEYNVNTFKANGIQNVYSVAPGVDVNEFNPNVPPLIAKDGRVRFLAVGEYTPRKGFDLLIPAYLAEFTNEDNVSLIVKAYNGSKRVNDSKDIIKKDILKWRSESPNILHPHILFLGDIMSNEKLPSLYTSADAYVLLTRGEGFGLPMAEAMACGIPCVLPNNSAYVDFVTNNNGYLVDIKGLEKYNDLHKASILYKDSESPIIDIMHARKILRHIYNNVQEASEKGKLARETIVQNYNFDVAAHRMFERLKKIETYWTPTIINSVTENFEELIFESKENGIVREEDISDSTVKINTVSLGLDNVGSVAMVIPTWGEPCGVADYTKRVVDKLEKTNNVIVVKNLYNLIDIVQRQDIKIVHFQHQYSLYNHAKLKETIEKLKMLNVQVVMTVHDYANDIKMSINNASFPLCDRLVVHSNMIKERIINDGYSDRNKVVVMIMGSDSQYGLDKITAKRNINMENRRIIASFGFLQPHKNWIEVVKAIPEIKKKYPNIIYLMISSVKQGQGVVNQYDQIIDDTIKRLNVGDHVKRFKSYLSEERILQMLAASDCIVLPYNNYKINGVEYWGVSIASRFSMRVQRPLIVSNASFFSDVENVACTIDVNPNNISNAVMDLFENEDLRRKIVLKQYNFTITNSWDAFAEKTIGLYREVRKLA